VREPRLVTAVGLAVAFDLAVDALEALANPICDRGDLLAGRQALGDLDPVVLGEVAAANGVLDESSRGQRQ
jgi:hypothetical protein